MVSTTSDHLKSIILGLGIYIFSVNALKKQKRAIQRGMSNPRGLKLRCYSARMIDRNDYLAVLPGGKSSEKFCEM